MANVKLRPEGDERFIFVAQRHWAALVMRSLTPALIALLALFGLALRILLREDDFLGRPPLIDPLNLLLMLAVVVCAGWIIYTWFDWRNDYLIVTNKRVVHEDRTLWLSYMYETIPLDQIQNVNVRIDNIFQYTLRYGRVEIQAAGPTSPIVFARANRPAEIQKQVLDESQRHKRNLEQSRLAATVERRLNPNGAPPPTPIPPNDEIGSLQGPMQAFLPLGPIQQGSVITWHRHWVVLLQHLIGPFVALLAWLGLFAAEIRWQLFNPAVEVGILFVLFVVVLLFFYWQYDNWRNDIYILEPTKIVDVQRLPFGLFEDRREATLGVIQNVNATSPNLVARILGYGNVLIETAGATGNFTFDHVPNPDQVQRIVFEYRERFRWQQREREWNNALNIVEMYHRASNRGNPPPP